MEEGQSRQVPILIYDISNNDPRHFQGMPVAVAFVNTQDREIASVRFTVSICATKASQVHTQGYAMEGPYPAGASFVVAPISLPDATGEQYRPVNSHMVINEVEVTDDAGTHSFTGKDVAKMLDDRIANYCLGDL